MSNRSSNRSSEDHSSEPLYPNVLDRLRRHASESPDKVALRFLGKDWSTIEESYTYVELDRRTDRLARVLVAKKGLRRGERAVLVYPPSLEFLVAFLSCLKAGLVAVPVFPPNPLRRDTLVMFSKIVQDCGATHALTSSSYNHMKKLQSAKETFVRLTGRSNASSPWPDGLKWLVTTGEANRPTPDDDSSSSVSSPKPPADSDLAFLQYTSGSTSDPKGVMITHGNLSHNLTVITDDLEASSDTVVVSWLPQYHDMGLIGSYLGVVHCGGTGHYASPLTFLARPSGWLEAVSRCRATHVQAPNFAYSLAVKRHDPSSSAAGALDLSSLRHMINAAEPVDAATLRRFKDTFVPHGLDPGVVYPTYGLAEHTVFVCSGGQGVLDVDREELETNRRVVLLGDATATTDDGRTTVGRRLVGCGFPARRGVDVRIVDDAEDDRPRDLGVDAVGEIWVRSPSKALGYYDQEEESARCFRARLDDDDDDNDGFLRTGDLGFLHDDELYVCGRLKDLIIVGGRNHYPQDIEATAVECSNNALRPGCAAAFAIDPPNGDGGEERVVLVAEMRQVPKSTDEVCKPLVSNMLKTIKSEHSISVAHIVLVQPRTIPKTTSGKIARAWCRKAFLGRTLSTVYAEDHHVLGGANNGDGRPSSSLAPLEIDRPDSSASEIRSADRESLLSRLRADAARIAGVNAETMEPHAALTTLLDSLSISQFKGLLERHYHATLSDEYLFRETTTLSKLVEVVRLGRAPDDVDGNGAVEAAASSPAGRSSGGLAGAMGCPPGVYCAIM